MMLASLFLGFLAALVGAFLAGRAQTSALASDVRTHILPYLRRRAAEVGVEFRPEDPRMPAGDAVTEACRLAAALVERERRELALGATLEIPRQPTEPT